ncbi:MAG: hypothetical protein O3B13_15420 [Planctomycetota bacterium]|nr:hypothetical protein [Planctomycetota bacterium]
MNSFLDTIDVNPGERSSADEDGNSTLRAAVMEANALAGADTIVLLPGTYRLTIAGRDENGAATGDLDITEALTIIGAGEGSTIIDASGLDRAFHVIAGASLNLKGITVINGSADFGGAILNQGNLTTENVTISGSTAILGGGIYNDIVVDELANSILGLATATTVTVTDASVFPRQAGFIIDIEGEQLQVIAISGNQFTVARGVNGTPIAAHLAGVSVTVVATSLVTLLNTKVTGNTAILNGGGVYNNDTLSVVLSSVSNNTAGVRGGGLYNTETVTIDRSTFDGNRAEVRGGAIFNEGTTTSIPSNIAITASTLSNNEAGARGGAIFNSDQITLLNSTISGNRAGGEGGAVFNIGPDALSAGSLIVVNSTIVLNSSDLTAGGIFNSTGSTASLTNSIVASNSAASSNNDVQGAFVSVRSNVIGDAGTSTGLVNGANGNLVGTTQSPIDPVFGPLASNGGPTQTHKLLIGSPAIDAGNNSGGEPLDQRGGRRPTDTTADIGAFEVQVNNLSINSVTMNEGSANSTFFVFTVLLEAVSADPVSISYGTIQDTAQQGGDFIATPGTLVFAPGELSKTITVEVNGDTTTEGNEQFFVQLFNPVNAVLVNDRGVGTILNDDAIVTFADVSVVEGNSGMSTATFTVVLSNATSEVIHLGYATVAGGTADEVVDYLAESGTLVFAAGDTTKSFTVTINGDTDVEAFETFLVDLSIVSGSVLLPDSQAVGTIANDDVQFADIIGDSVEESMGPATFTVGLTQLNAYDITVNVRTVNGTATGGSDFTALPSTPVVIPAGMMSVTQDITIINDTVFEGGAGTFETFTLEYVPGTTTQKIMGVDVAVADALGAAGMGSIEDDELPPTVWIIRVLASDATMGEVLRDDPTDAFGPLNYAPLSPYLLSAGLLTVNGDPGNANDRFIVDFDNGNPIPIGGLSIVGGNQTSGDSLEIVDSNLNNPPAAFTFTSVVYTSTGVDSGDIDINDGTLMRTITYAELEPVLDTVAAVSRTFAIDSTANPGNHSISVSDTGGLTIIDDGGTNAFESVTFANPTTTLLLNAGNGNNTVTIGALDVGFSAAFTIDGEGGDDNINASTTNIAVSIMGGDGEDILIGGAGIDTIDGEAGDDSIQGGAGNDLLSGGADDDTILGEAGGDVIDGGAGNDSLFGGADNDSILGQDGGDIIFGEGGMDTLEGGTGNDTIDGGDDNDSILGESGADSLSGGNGNDIVDGGADNDTLAGGSGLDNLVGGDGTDQVAEVAVGAENITLTDSGLVVGGLSDVISTVEEFILTGGDLSSIIDASTYTLGNVTIDGAGGDDTLKGGFGNDFINGGSGNDVIFGNAGNDSLLGGSGADVMDGGTANDTLAGNAGDDTLTGGVGEDSLDGGADSDVIDGGDDSDTVRGGSGADSIDGGSGNDLLQGDAGNDTISGDDDDDTLVGGSGQDILRGEAGVDNLNGMLGDDYLDGGADDDTAFGGAGQDILIGGQGIDNLDGQGSSFDTILLVGTSGDDVYTLSRLDFFNELRILSDPTFGINFKRTETIQLNTLDGNDSLTTTGDLSGSDGAAAFVINFGTGNNTLDASLNLDPSKNFIVVSGSGNDTLKGGAGPDNLNAGAGDDLIEGGLGDDTLTGGDGADVINGNAGLDYVDGGTGDDSLQGGSEADTLEGGTGNDTIRGNEGDDLILGDDGNDLLYGDEGNDDIDGGRDNDSIDGGANDDTVQGGRGYDVIKGGDGNDSLEGGDHNDTIDGGNGIDFLNGQAHNDVLIGGADNDRLIGGSGTDTVIGGTGADDINGQGSNSDVLVGETALAGTGDDTSDPGDTFDDSAEIDNAFVLNTAIFDLLNSF